MNPRERRDNKAFHTLQAFIFFIFSPYPVVGSGPGETNGRPWADWLCSPIRLRMARPCSAPETVFLSGLRNLPFLSKNWG